MAFDVSTLAAYIENRDFPLVAKMQFDPELKAGRATLQDGIKKSSALHFMDTDVVFQVGSCTRTASGTTTLTDKTITVAAIDIAEDLCLEDLVGKWAQITLSKGVREGRQILPAEIAEIYFDLKMVKYKQALSVADWQGDTGSGNAQINKYDGWIKLIDAGSPIDGNTGGVTVATGVTVSNILAILDAMYLARPTALRGRTDVTIDMPQEWFDLYIVALKNANLFHFTSSEGETKLYGTTVNIKGDYGLNGTNRMFLSSDANYVVGLDSESDGEFETRLDPVSNKKILLDASFRRGTQIQFTELVVEFTLVP
jgi:hypothetical protein